MRKRKHDKYSHDDGEQSYNDQDKEYPWHGKSKRRDNGYYKKQNGNNDYSPGKQAAWPLVQSQCFDTRQA
jgi:hypothetical protein